MIGRTLFRYLFARQLAMLGWRLLGLTGLIVMVDLTEVTSRFGDA